jgi:DNA-binding NarL/FixJ family response regulator
MQTITILVEDNKTIRDQLIPAMAEEANIQVVAIAETASEAVDAIARYGAEWQLAVVDLFLKEGSGLTVLNACSKRLPHQRAVVLTNYATDDIRKRCLQLGADAVFDKSTEIEAFLQHCSLYP